MTSVKTSDPTTVRFEQPNTNEAEENDLKNNFRRMFMRKWSGTTNASINSRIQEMEKRISSAEDTLEETDTLVKENIKSNKSLTQNIQEIWNTMKRSNLRIIGIEEGEVQLKSTENIFNKVIEENFPNLKKDMPMTIQEVYRTPNRLDQKKSPLATG